MHIAHNNTSTLANREKYVANIGIPNISINNICIDTKGVFCFVDSSDAYIIPSANLGVTVAPKRKIMRQRK